MVLLSYVRLCYSLILIYCFTFRLPCRHKGQLLLSALSVITLDTLTLRLLLQIHGRRNDYTTRTDLTVQINPSTFDSAAAFKVKSLSKHKSLTAAQKSSQLNPVFVVAKQAAR